MTATDGSFEEAVKSIRNATHLFKLRMIPLTSQQILTLNRVMFDFDSAVHLQRAPDDLKRIETKIDLVIDRLMSRH